MMFVKVDVEQGSPEWHRWRKGVITGTDCASILGSSPWQTAYKCWQRKMGYIPEKEKNAAMERGVRLEPGARAAFIEASGIEMVPMCVESRICSFIGASLDGISPCGRYLLEIKRGGQQLIDMGRNGIIPDYYMDQIQHMLFATSAEKCYYDFDGYDSRIEVLPDPGFADMYLPKATAFYKCIADDEAPPLAPSDYKDMEGNSTWSSHVLMYQSLDREIKALEERKASYRAELIKLCDDQSSQGFGAKVIKMHVKGRVEYDKIPLLDGVDLNQYRKPSTTCWKVMIDKE